MGGKAKQSQRTKNNVRPSSSSRSAELLNNTVSLDGGLVTVGSGKVLPTLFPSLAALTLDQGLPNEFQICIKKLNKKDPITRTKALQELCELVNNSNVDDVVAVLPSWAHSYKTLTADTDRKVREMTQLCQCAMMRVCGRRAAPQLRVLVPAWLAAQYDEHAPAQAHAHNSLTNTFPDKKLPEVISFCRMEVMAYFIENLIGNTEAIITKKIEQVEDRELVLCRMVTSSLRGLEYFIPALPAQHHEWLWAELAALLGSSRYWKYATHNAAQLRAAWYGALGRIVERYKEQFAEQYGPRALRAALAASRDAGALLAAQIWTTLLQFMHNIHDWHKYLDKKELLVKRIIDVLESGGWGDARHLSNILLPLLAHLPPDILTKEFYETFFSAIYKGLNKKSIISSKSERQAWITSLAECLRYLSIQQNEFVVEVATSVHRTWLENIFSSHHDAQTRHNLIKCSTASMASLVKYWLKQSQEGNSEKYDQLLRNFWQNTGATVLSHIDKCGVDLDELDRLIEGHILLLLTLKSTFLQGIKKQQCIKFDGDEPSVPENSSVTTEQCDPSILERYRHSLDDLAHKMCAHYFEIAEKRQVSNAVLTPLITVLNEFDSKELFAALARQFDVDSPYKFYDKVLKSWLSGDTMRCKVIVDIIFQMMKYLSEEEQDAVFDSFNQLMPCVSEWGLGCVRRGPGAGQGAGPGAGGARRWARSRGARAALVSLAGRACAHDDSSAAALLLTCLADTHAHTPPLFGVEAVSEVISVVSEAIASGADGHTLERSGALAAQLVTLLANSALIDTEAPHFTTLVLRLFRLNLLVPCGDSRMSPETWEEVRSSWQQGAVTLAPAARTRLLDDAALILRAHLIQQLASLNIQKIEHMVSLCLYLFDRSVGDDSELPNEGVVGEIVKFTQQIFNMEDKESIMVEICALRYDIITSQLNCLYDDDNEAVKNVLTNSAEIDQKELSKLEVTLYVNKLMFRAIYLKTLLLNKIVSEDEQTSEQHTWCDTLLAHQYIEDQFCNILYNYSVLCSLNEGYTFWAHYGVIEAAQKKLSSLVGDVLGGVAGGGAGGGALRARAASRGYHWARAHAHAGSGEHGTRGTHGTHDTHGEPDDLPSGNGYFHMLQASTKGSGDEDLAYKVAYLVMLRSWNVAHSHLMTADVVRDMAVCRPSHDLDVIVNAYYKNQQTMLYDVDITEAPWSQVVSNVSVVEFLTLMVQQRGWDAPAHHWDFTTITLCSLLTSLRNSQSHWATTKVSMLARSVLRLFGAVSQFVANVRGESERRRPAPHVLALVSAEWPDMFAPDTHHNIYTVTMHVLGSCDSSSVSCPASVVLSSLIAVLPHVSWHCVAPTRASADLSLSVLARAVSGSLRRVTHPAHKYLAYYLLLNIAEELVFDDSQKLSMWSEENSGDGDEEKAPPEFLFNYFDETFTHLQDIVETALNNVVLGEETCELVSLSDSHVMALGWLLLADALGAIYKLARGDLQQFYIQIYRERKYASALLTSALRLLPPEVFACAADSSSPAAAPAHHTRPFLQLEPFSMSQACSGAHTGALACRVVCECVCGAGCGSARAWWGAAPGRLARLLERLVLAHVAPHARRTQLADLHARAAEIRDAEIRIAWSNSEVVCLLAVEESTVELRAWLARAHPLVPPRLLVPDSAGPGGNTQWLALYLGYQNGTLLNALKMWTRAVNARVERSPQCYICYCRLHAATGRLPRVPCHQCRSRFHNQCLRKWFATSNKSNCPLCRATF